MINKNLIIADLHLHSKYSRAVSQKMDLIEIATWATRKGIDLVGTADWTHPVWFREIQSQLKETEPGLFKLKKTPSEISSGLRFVLTVELSNIYSHNGQTRRIHTVVFSPNLSICEKVRQALINRGVNLKSDGRPIMGLSIIELAELLWSVSEDIFILPAHIWTPWFSVYGSKSGYDSIKECYGQYADRITAIETGLSSDPIMNWSVPELASRAIVSSSDAHSGPKLGREATVFKIKNQKSKIKYLDLIGAMKQDPKANLEIAFTIEFFPEEGKYHFSGHRKCEVVFNPKQVEKNKGLCPKCKKPLTIGVMDRVKTLAQVLISEDELVIKKSHSHTSLVYPPKVNRPPFVSIVPLLEILAHLAGTSTHSKKVSEKYHQLIAKLGTEFEILLFKPIEEIEQAQEPLLAKAIKKMRAREVQLEPGYDGVFGKIFINVAAEETSQVQQESLF